MTDMVTHMPDRYKIVETLILHVSYMHCDFFPFPCQILDIFSIDIFSIFINIFIIAVSVYFEQIECILEL